MARPPFRVTWLLHTVAAICLILVIVFSVWWVRSYWVSDWLTWHTVKPWQAGFKERDQASLMSFPGSLEVTKLRATGPVSEVPGFSWTRVPASVWTSQYATAHLSFWNKLGFGYRHDPGGEPSLAKVQDTVKHPVAYTWDYFGIAVPFWLLCLLSAAMPAMWVRRRAANRARDGAVQL